MINQEEIIVEICDQFDAYIKEKVIKELSDSYMQLHREIDKRSMVRKNTIELPRLSHYLRSLFFHIFEKLHKGEKHEAEELLAELKIQLHFLNQKNDVRPDPSLIVDDVSYAQEEYKAVLRKYSFELERSMKDLLLESYNKVTIEISQRNLAVRSGYSEPKLEKLINHALWYLFAKLHNGDKQKADEIMDKMKADIIDNKIIS